MTTPRIVIIGGGLAGMSAAVTLESVGATVTLLEASRKLGGRASSYIHPTAGEELDNCQHVLLGCCTNLVDFYKRAGVRHLITFEKTVHFVDPRGRRFDLGATDGFPAPLHLAGSMFRFGVLTSREKIALHRAMHALLRVSREDRKRFEDIPFGDWLAEHRQPDSLVRKLYDPILIGALNDECRRSSCAYAMQVLQEALLANRRGYLLGLPNCPLSRLYASLPIRDLRLRTRVTGFTWDANKITGVEIAGGEAIAADAVALATNHHAIEKLIPENLRDADDRFEKLDKLESVPILGAHLIFDRPILKESHCAFIEGPLQWLFRKDADGRVVHGVISAARDWVNVDREFAIGLFVDQIRKTLRLAREAQLVRGTTVIEKRATFCVTPGTEYARPPQTPLPTGLANLFLAGDYTKTGWPATMEGAVRSGYLAAEAICAQWPIISGPVRFIREDLPVEWPARILGMR